jgi:hypothetical protein
MFGLFPLRSGEVAMVCNKCGQTLSDDSAFCEQCGTRIDQTQTLASSNPVDTARRDSRPIIAVNTQALHSKWQGLIAGEKLVVAGSALAILAFFLPWISVDNPFPEGPFAGVFNGAASANASGFDFGRFWGGFYLIPLAAILSVALTYYSVTKQDGVAVARANALILAVAAVFGPQMLLGPLFIPLAQKVFAFGWFLTATGFCIICWGGFLNLTKPRRSVAPQGAR